MRSLMRKLTQGLRIRMRDRVKQQRDPEGFRYIPRKRDQIGKIRRTGALFQMIGRQIKTEYSDKKAAVGFSGRTAKIAQIHQEGLTQRPSRTADPVAYPRRELVGFSEDDKSWIETTIFEFLSSK
nr:phage virion morphogenesis protein [Acinetobacter dispersus]